MRPPARRGHAQAIALLIAVLAAQRDDRQPLNEEHLDQQGETDAE